MEEIVYLNGSLIPRSKAWVSVFDHGFLYGYGLFETMRAYNGRIFLLERHIKRLLGGAEAIGLSLDGIDLSQACIETLAANNLKEARLRLTVTRGEVESFPGPAVSRNPTVLVTANRYSPLPFEIYERGFKAGISSHRRCRQSSLSALKTTNYLGNVLARLEAGACGLDEALLLNELGEITEGSISNVFFVTSSSELITPPLTSGLLPGITREAVIELAKAQGITASEKTVKPKDLGRLAGAFLTNSVMELMPLVEVRVRGKAITIGTGRAEELTKRLMSAYRQMVVSQTTSK